MERQPHGRRKPQARATAGALAVVLLAAAHAWPQARPPASVELRIDFQEYRYGVPPRELVYDAAGRHGPVLTAGRPFWRTYVDLFAPSPKLVLVQASALAEPDHYPIAWLRGFAAADLRLGVHLKLIDGRLDRSAGLVWRARDNENFYAVLASAADDRLRLLAMRGGEPVEIAAAPVSLEVEFERREPSPTWGWHHLRVAAAGDRITVWLDDEKRIETRDATFPKPGRMGLITHADSVAAFDDLHLQTGAEPLAAPPTRQGERR